jgi:hypothetical protein
VHERAQRPGVEDEHDSAPSRCGQPCLRSVQLGLVGVPLSEVQRAAVAACLLLADRTQNSHSMHSEF